MYSYYKVLAIFSMLYDTFWSLSHTQQFVSPAPTPVPTGCSPSPHW